MRFGPALTLISVALLYSGCASSPSSSKQGRMAPLPDEPFGTTQELPMSACLKWRKGLGGHLSHTSVSKNGAIALVSTSSEGRADGFARVLDSAGTLLWAQPLPQPVKAQSLSRDGDLFALNTYDGKLRIYKIAKKGRRRPQALWIREHLGKPVFAENAGRIVLLNDDDSEPQVAFVSYDYAGNLKGRVELKGASEPVDMFLSNDEHEVYVALADRSVQAYTVDGTFLWKTLLPGDAIAIAAPKASGTVYALLSEYRQGKGASRTLVALSPQAGNQSPTVLWQTSLDRPYESVRVVDATVFLYGNSYRGQAISAFQASTGKELWRRSYNAPATYASPVFSGNVPAPFMAVAIEDGVQAGVMHILAASGTGTVLWNAAIEAASGIYSFSTAENDTALIVGTGEPGKGTVEYYSIAQGQACAGKPSKKRVQ